MMSTMGPPHHDDSAAAHVPNEPFQPLGSASKQRGGDLQTNSVQASKLVILASTYATPTSTWAIPILLWTSAPT